jgi:DNA polymerase-3 subunit delta'
MPIVPLFGHSELRQRLARAFSRGTLPSTLLFEGSRGVGKQRLALWLGQLLLCDKPVEEPCGVCAGCRYVLELQHPDLHWYFPRPRPRDSDPDLEDVRLDVGEAVAERAAAKGLYAPPSGMDGIFVATTRLIVRQAAVSPALASRKVFIVGDAERMVPQEGKDEAANAFLKLLEEPPANTTVILTTSEPGSLLPTVRSRVVSFRVAPLPLGDVEAFLSDEHVARRLAEQDGVPEARSKRVTFAAGAPGRLLAGEGLIEAKNAARRMLDAASGGTDTRYEVAWLTSSTKARGGFADTLDALTEELHNRAAASVRRGSAGDAYAATKAIDAVEVAKERILTNVSPQLITVNLLRELRALLT